MVQRRWGRCQLEACQVAKQNAVFEVMAASVLSDVRFHILLVPGSGSAASDLDTTQGSSLFLARRAVSGGSGGEKASLNRKPALAKLEEPSKKQ